MEHLSQEDFNINSPNEDGLTPLHQAIYHNDIQMISKLLYHGADVNAMDRRGFTPFLQATILFNLPAMSLLSNYHQQFRPRFTYGYYKDILDLKSTEDELIIHNQQFLNFMVALWKKLPGNLQDFDIDGFLRNYLKECGVRENYNLLANCFYILQFALPFYLGKQCACSFSELFLICEDRLIVQSDRMELVWTWLSLGVEVVLDDVQNAFMLYGFDEEVQALLSTTTSPFLTLFLALEDDCNNEMVITKYLSRGFESPIFKTNWLHPNTIGLINKFLKFFALSWRMKQDLLRKCTISEVDDVGIRRKLVEKPEVPLLSELSRNSVTKYAKKNFVIQTIVDYENIVSNLEITGISKEILLLQRSLYV